MPETAEHILRVGGKGAARFLIDGKEVMSGALSVSWNEAEKPVRLEKGPHLFTIQYCTAKGASEIYLRLVRVSEGKRVFLQPNGWLLPLRPETTNR